MKSCWETLNIAVTENKDIIRQAYLALLPSFHPETDPQGFKQLRQAYEAALRLAESPSEETDISPRPIAVEHEILIAFRALLASDTDRFQSAAWQRFIQRLNTYSIDEVDELRWRLCEIAMASDYLSFDCIRLLAERLSWRQQPNTEQIVQEELESFLDAIGRSDIFAFSTLTDFSAVAQNEAIDFFRMFGRIWFNNPEWLAAFLSIHRTVVTPDDTRLHRNLLRWYSALKCGMPELLTYARAWREAEPENEDAHYYACAQRVYCGESDSLLPDLCAFWQRFPSTQADALLLYWCRQHRIGTAPLLALVIEARELVNDKGKPLIYIPGDSAHTRLLWADILYSGDLSPLSRDFLTSWLNIRSKPRMKQTPGQESGSGPLLSLYQVADRLVCSESPAEAPLQSLVSRLDDAACCPLEAIIIRWLLVTSAEASRVETPQPVKVESEAAGNDGPGIIKIIFYIVLICGAVVRILHHLAATG